MCRPYNLGHNNFIEVFVFCTDRTGIAFASTNTFLGDNETLSQQKRYTSDILCSAKSDIFTS